MEAGVSAEHLLRLPVRVRGIDVGHAVDVFVDTQAWRVLGLDVLCRDDAHRFLPLTAARVGDEEIAVASALTMLAEDELAFYRRRATTLRALRGKRVLDRGRDAGALEDVLVEPGGEITELALTNGRSQTTLAAGERVVVAGAAA